MEAIGEWGIRYVDSLTDEDLDPAFLLWDVRRNVDTDALPEGRTVVELTLQGLDPEVRDWWLLLSDEEVDVCDHDPGFPTDVAIDTPVRTFIDVWRGDIGWNDALRNGTMEVHGPPRLRRQVPEWFQLSHFAGVER